MFKNIHIFDWTKKEESPFSPAGNGLPARFTLSRLLIQSQVKKSTYKGRTKIVASYFYPTLALI